MDRRSHWQKRYACGIGPYGANKPLLRDGFAVTKAAYDRKASEKAKPIGRCVPAPLCG